MAARRSNAITIAISILLACALWGYVTLTRTYEDDVDVRVVVRPPAGQTIISNVPATVTVRVRTSGLRIANFRLFNEPSVCTLAVDEQMPNDPSMFRIGNSSLLRELASTLGVRVTGVSPVDIMVRTGTPEIKSVPLVISHSIECRPGFVLTAQPTADRARVTLKGIRQVIEPLDHWSTKRIMIADVHESISIDVPLSDSLRSMVDVMPKTVRVHIPVQQVAEVQVNDVEVQVSPALMAQGYVARPNRIRVTLRGGVDDLALVTRSDVRAEVAELQPYGVAVPQVTCPAGMRVIAIRPRTIQLARRQPL